MEWLLGIVLLVFIILYIKKNYKTIEPARDECKNEKTYTYNKKCLMTETEKQFFSAIKNAADSAYVVLPQVNLATVIEKQGDFKYQNELYRNIDFCIFDLSFNPLLLIEINDDTHNDPKRRKRDIKVKDISNKAGIPIVTFYTKYGINQEYIATKLQEYLK